MGLLDLADWLDSRALYWKKRKFDSDIALAKARSNLTATLQRDPDATRRAYERVFHRACNWRLAALIGVPAALLIGWQLRGLLG